MSAGLRQLMEQKDALEREILDISDALTASNLGGISGPLVDTEGFPRADVDVHTTRTLRHRLACLNTDHQQLMQQIEQGLLAHHAALREGGGGAPMQRQPSAMPQSRVPVTSVASPAAPAPPAVAVAAPPARVTEVSPALMNGHDALHPFAEIDEVAEGGPAATAGIQPGDKLLTFGGLHAGNHDQLRALARMTQRSIGSSIPLRVLRTEAAREEMVELVLHPRQWVGQGLLGCHLRPL
jgi:26S proteasome regulatory subunit N4